MGAGLRTSPSHDVIAIAVVKKPMINTCSTYNNIKAASSRLLSLLGSLTAEPGLAVLQLSHVRDRPLVPGSLCSLAAGVFQLAPEAMELWKSAQSTAFSLLILLLLLPRWSHSQDIPKNCKSAELSS